MLDVQSNNSEKLFLKKKKNHPPFHSPHISSKILREKGKISTMVFYKDTVNKNWLNLLSGFQYYLRRSFRHLKH